MRKHLVWQAMVGSTLLAATVRADFITNGSFESITGSTINNWTLTPTASSGAVTDYPAATGTSPYGSRFLAFNAGVDLPGGSATQDLNSLDSDTTYALTFAWGAYGTTGTQTLQLTINVESAPAVMTYIDTTPSTNLGTLWQTETFTFSGANIPTGVTFGDLGVTLTGDSDMFVDNVSLNIVPEPLGIAGVSVSFCVMAYQRKRR